MAFEADCGVSPVLEEIRMASTAALVAQASRLHVQPGRLHPQDTPGRFVLEVHASRLLGGKFEIRNSKFEIRIPKPVDPAAP